MLGTSPVAPWQSVHDTQRVLEMVCTVTHDSDHCRQQLTPPGPGNQPAGSVIVLQSTKKTCFVCHRAYVSVVRERTCQERWKFYFCNFCIIVLWTGRHFFLEEEQKKNFLSGGRGVTERGKEGFFFPRHVSSWPWIHGTMTRDMSQWYVSWHVPSVRNPCESS